MISVQLPGSVCASLHPDYQGDETAPDVKAFLRKAAQEMIRGAIKSWLSPATLPQAHDPGLEIVLSFSGAFAIAIDRVANAENQLPGHVAKRFLLAAVHRGDVLNHRFEVEQDRESLLDAYVATDPFLTRRKEQVVFFDCLMDCLNNQKIGLVEGATGIGKTLAMIAAAAETLNGIGQGRAVIAAPTLQVLKQFILQHRKIDASGAIRGLPRHRVTIGRQEFLDPTELRAVLADQLLKDIDTAPILAWLDEGAPAMGDATTFGRPYMATSLLAVSPGFPVELVTLGSRRSENAGENAYAEQFQVEEGEESKTEIIYCTHAMLAVDTRRAMMAGRRGDGEGVERLELIQDAISTLSQQLKKSPPGAQERKDAMRAINSLRLEWAETMAANAVGEDGGHLPPWQYLLLDEAHLFETNLANAFSSYYSVVNICREIADLADAGELKASAGKQARKALEGLTELSSINEMNLANTDHKDVIRALVALRELNEIVLAHRPTKTAKSSDRLVQLRNNVLEIERGLTSAASRTGGIAAFLRFSPIRQYPQLFVGRMNVQAELQFLWASTRCIGAACVSATLYLPRIDGESSYYIRNILSIQDRYAKYPPIRPAWMTEPVKGVYLPVAAKVGDRKWLRPPMASDNLPVSQFETSEDAWLDDLARAMVRIHTDAVGGTLVLMTSFASAHGLANRLAGIAPLIVASNEYPKQSVQEQLRRFAAAERPIWITVGGAWTGLDINGKDHGRADPATDNLLTDLVIPRIPYGLNRTMSHYARTARERDSTPYELFDTTMRFKQGVGRLIRRQGLPRNRRIFMLDARIHDPSSAGWNSAILRLLNIYPQVEFSYQP